ncbi:MAG: shikimate kinase [Pseudomonadota bacterium]
MIEGTPGRGRHVLRPIVLIGLMGAGKSSVGQRLAQMLGTRFVDSDTEVEAAAAMTVSEIFAALGEASFREGERRVIARLLEAGPCVMATGGGAFMAEETRSVIAERAVSVWLVADLDLLVKRTAGRTHRPLLNTGDPRATLAKLIETRYPVYAKADLHVQSEAGQSHENMAVRIVEALVVHGQRTGQGALGEEEV